MKEIGDPRFVAAFLRGQADCRKGIPHEDKGEYYNRGYAAEYASQEVIAWHYEHQERKSCH